MKTIVHLDLTDEQRVIAAQNLFGRKAPVKRAELQEFVQGCIEFIVQPPSLPAAEPIAHQPTKQQPCQVDSEDQAFLADKSPGFIRGWNAVKYRNKGASA